LRYVRTAEDVATMRAFALRLLELADRLDADRLPAVPTPAYVRPHGQTP
jgi:hypothetical protein